MTISRVADIVQKCHDGGQSWTAGFRKVPAIASVQGIWSDLSSAPGNPRPNYYVGTELTLTTLTSDRGLYHGGSVSPATKHLHQVLVMAPGATLSPSKFYVLDYLGFYPLIDMDSTDEQALVTSAPLARYADGEGVMAMLVATNPYIGGAQFVLNYTNQDGVSGRQSAMELCNTATFIGTVVHSGVTASTGGPFIRLAPGDRGIRSVQSITFLAPNGGLAALVLVKPLALVSHPPDVNACAEWDFAQMKPTLPRVLDGAYLNLIGCPNGSWAALPITGLVTFVWN